VLTGDLLDEGFDKETAPANWAEFCRDYGLTGEDGRLCFPVYEGFGNHDGGPTKSFVRAGIKARNPKRVGLKAISENGLHYSWDWDQLHLAQLNLFGGSSAADVKGVNGPEHDPEQSLDFLRYDLGQNVGASQRPVIPFQHFAWLGGMSDWWHPEAKERFYEVVKTYNVACLINGHSHGVAFVPFHDLLTIHAGSTARGESDTGDFLVVRVTATELIVIQRKLGGWGLQTRRPLRAAKSEQ
jgi:cytolysin (calcineurin-like family phosphatase)